MKNTGLFFLSLLILFVMFGCTENYENEVSGEQIGLIVDGVTVNEEVWNEAILHASRLVIIKEYLEEQGVATSIENVDEGIDAYAETIAEDVEITEEEVLKRVEEEELKRSEELKESGLETLTTWVDEDKRDERVKKDLQLEAAHEIINSEIEERISQVDIEIVYNEVSDEQIGLIVDGVTVNEEVWNEAILHASRLVIIKEYLEEEGVATSIENVDEGIDAYAETIAEDVEITEEEVLKRVEEENEEEKEMGILTVDDSKDFFEVARSPDWEEKRDERVKEDLQLEAAHEIISSEIEERVSQVVIDIVYYE